MNHCCDSFSMFILISCLYLTTFMKISLFHNNGDWDLIPYFFFVPLFNYLKLYDYLKLLTNNWKVDEEIARNLVPIFMYNILLKQHYFFIKVSEQHSIFIYLNSYVCMYFCFRWETWEKECCERGARSSCSRIV